MSNNCLTCKWEPKDTGWTFYNCPFPLPFGSRKQEMFKRGGEWFVQGAGRVEDCPAWTAKEADDG